jgi:hypothetical protein
LRMSLTPLPDTRYASLIATMQLANDFGFPQVSERVPGQEESHPLARLQCLKSLDDLDEEEDDVKDEDEDDDDLEDEEDEDEDEDLDEDYDEDEDDEDEDEDEEEDEDEDGGVKPLKMIS